MCFLVEEGNCLKEPENNEKKKENVSKQESICFVIFDKTDRLKL